MPYLERAMRAGPKPSVDDSDCLFGHRAPVPAGSRRPARSSSGCRRKPALSAAVTGLSHLPGVRRFRFSADLGLVLRRTRRRCGQRGLGGIGGLADGPGEERAAVRDTPQSARDWLEETGSSRKSKIIFRNTLVKNRIHYYSQQITAVICSLRRCTGTGTKRGRRPSARI